MSDIHGTVEPIYELKKNKIEEIGGFSRILTIINAIKEKYPNNSILTMQGDYLLEDFQIGKYFSKFKGKAVFSLMDQFQIDIATLGNHEFDYGVNAAREALKYCNFPIVITNITFLSKKPNCCHKEYIIEKNGYKIGFIGLMTPYLLRYKKTGIDLSEIKLNQNLIELTKEKIFKLKKKHQVDVIVVLSHLGLEEDKKLASKVPEITIICGGHSHDKTEKEIVINHINNKKTIIVHTGDCGKNIGILKIFKEENGETNYLWDLIKIGQNVKKDSSMELLINNYKEKFLLDSDFKIACKSIIDLRKDIVRSKETAIGNFTSDIFRKYFNTDIALISGEAFKGNKIILPRTITDLDIKNIFLFKNFHIVKVKGKVLKKTLEISVSKFPKKSYSFRQVSGLKFSFDPSKEPIVLKKEGNNQFKVIQEGNRIQNIDILQKDGRYIPLDEQKEYFVLFDTSFIPQVRDFFLFNNSSIIKKMDITPQNILIDYLQNINIISPKIEGRILIRYVF